MNLSVLLTMFTSKENAFLAVVPAAIGLFTLRVARAGLPRRRLLYAIAATLIWSCYFGLMMVRAFSQTGMMARGVLFGLSLSLVPAVLAGGSGLLIGGKRRINIVVAVILVLAIAVLAAVFGQLAATSMVDLVEASG